VYAERVLWLNRQSIIVTPVVAHRRTSLCPFYLQLLPNYVRRSHKNQVADHGRIGIKCRHLH
jgi:hypothetical protein